MAGKYARRKWNGKPGSALSLDNAPPDPAKIRTRFPPEAQRLSALRPRQVDLPQLRPRARLRRRLPLRFDDTNPAKEETEYVDSIAMR